MLIHAMTRQACIDLLTRNRLNRLASARDGQPYITPMHYVYDGNYLYSFSTLGQKITWMRENPLVCVEVDEIISPHDWAIVIVLGEYEELPNTPQYQAHRKRAHDLLKQRPVWWEPGYVKTLLDELPRPMEPMYFRIQIKQISGHRGVPDTDSAQKSSATHKGSLDWLQTILRRTKRKHI